MNPLFKESLDLGPGALVETWRVLGRVGIGTYGAVYRVARAGTPAAGEYALKLARYPGDARFDREAELLSLIHHPHVPRYQDRGSWRDPEGQSYPYVVMQLVEGVPLYDWARRHSPTSRQALQLLGQVARALEATHQHGVHRDVKGDNVLVDREGRAMLVDFGLAWYSEARPITDNVIPPGTEPYRSHQLLRFRYHHRWDVTAHYDYRPDDDIYALGVTAYRLVTGTYPPAGTDPECADDPERPRPARLLPPSELASVSPELEALILRMLSEKPGARGTAGELALAMEEAARSAGRAADVPIKPSPSMAPTEDTQRPGPRRRLAVPDWMTWAGAAVLGGLVVLAGSELRHRPTEPAPVSQPIVAEVIKEPEAPEEPEKPDAGTVGLADAGVDDRVLASVAVDVPQAGMPTYAIALRMPKSPLPGQRKPPCDTTSEVLVIGACWVVIAKKPPCEQSGYEHDGKCVIPVLTAPRPPTSDQP